ncbi:GNAT family N-acetyltransferase [Oxalobacteraceae bacterium OM1]|nr:GNAT family N-acetyltransferase [Oxalobacteraceae bacterium OM1]
MTPLRQATAADKVAILALLKDSGLPYQDIEETRLNDFLVAEGGQSLLGAVGLEVYGDAALLRSLVVRPESRWTGLGNQLVTAIEEHARQKGVSTVYLLTTTAADYFVRRGYDTMPRSEAPAALQATTEFAGLCPSQAVCMRRRLA